MYREHTIAAVVPAYNEEGFVGEVIDGLPSFVDRAYVVDDGSTDNTWAEITEQAAKRNEAHDGHFERLVVPIQHDSNRGVGGAIKTGYLRAREEGIDATVVLGGDDQMDPSELTRYLDPIVDDVVGYAKGNRFARPEDWAEMPRFRLLGNVVLSYLTKVASGYWSIMDSQNGYTAISLEALEQTDIEGMYEYYGYCNDLLVRLNVAGVRVGDVPRSSTYAYSEGWKSHIDYKEYIPRVSVMLFRSFLWRLRRKYIMERYDPLAPLYLLGIGSVTAGAAGLVSAVLRRREGAGSYLISMVAGALMVLYAGVLDRAENEHLEFDLAREGSETDSAVDSDRSDRSEATDGHSAPKGTIEQRPPSRRAPTSAQPDGGSGGADGPGSDYTGSGETDE